jgi:hypothetical protein
LRSPRFARAELAQNGSAPVVRHSSASAMVSVVDKLEDQGLVKRVPHL